MDLENFLQQKRDAAPGKAESSQRKSPSVRSTPYKLTKTGKKQAATTMVTRTYEISPFDPSEAHPLEGETCEGNRYVSTGLYQDKVQIKIREYMYDKDASLWYYTKKGINLTPEQWCELHALKPTIDREIMELMGDTTEK